MVAFTKFQDTVERLGLAVHNFDAAGHVIKAALHSDAPVVATDDELADLSQPTGTGYTAGGIDIQNTWAESSGTASMGATDVVWTAGAGDWTAFRYVCLHNDTSTTDKLVGDWDSGGNVTLANAETYTVDFGSTVCTLT